MLFVSLLPHYSVIYSPQTWCREVSVWVWLVYLWKPSSVKFMKCVCVIVMFHLSFPLWQQWEPEHSRSEVTFPSETTRTCLLGEEMHRKCVLSVEVPLDNWSYSHGVLIESQGSASWSVYLMLSLGCPSLTDPLSFFHSDVTDATGKRDWRRRVTRRASVFTRVPRILLGCKLQVSSC